MRKKRKKMKRKMMTKRLSEVRLRMEKRMEGEVWDEGEKRAFWQRLPWALDWTLHEPFRRLFQRGSLKGAS